MRTERKRKEFEDERHLARLKEGALLPLGLDDDLYRLKIRVMRVLQLLGQSANGY